MTESVYEAGAWIYKMFFTFIIAIVAIFIVANSIKTDLNAREVQKELLFHVILYTSDAIWYQENGITYPGIIDLNRFDQQRIDASLHYPDNYGGAHLMVVRGEAQIVAAQAYVNRLTYNNLQTLTGTGAQQAGLIETRVYPVQIRNGDNKDNGYLIIQVTMPEIA